MPITPVLRTYELWSLSASLSGVEMYSMMDGSRRLQSERSASPRTIGSSFEQSRCSVLMHMIAMSGFSCAYVHR